MKILDVQQGSVEWMQARAGIPTASEFDALVTPEWKIRTGDMPKTYLAKKLAEWWQGGPLLEFNMFDMEQGKILEEEAIPWFELEFNQPVQRVGFITTDDGRIGCSPDGFMHINVTAPDPKDLRFEHSGLEIKCPRPETHTGYLLTGTVPKAYLAQVHGGMFVTGAASWQFLSYRRRFPKLVLTVERDANINDCLIEALAKFLDAFDAGKARLCELNGGPPIRPIRPIPSQVLTATTDNLIP